MHCYSRHFYRNWGGFRAKQALMHLASGSFQLDDFQFVLILKWGAIFMASRFLVCKAANAAIKLFFCVILLAGVLRLVLGRNLKIALVFGVVCIGVKGFFCGSAASARLWLSRCGGRQDRFWVGSWHHVPLQEPFDIFVGSWYTTSNRCESVGGGCVAFSVLSCS